MRDDARAKREAQIADAAYALLEEKGYSGTSMLAIARKARASNETLYNWYGDKTGLFKALIVRNSVVVGTVLDSDTTQLAPMEVIEILGPKLLGLLLSARAIALNRAAVSDPTGELGSVLTDAGRNTVLPKIGPILEAAKARGEIHYDTLDDALGTYISLLVGDLQIRRAIGVLDELDYGQIEARSRQALDQFKRVFSATV